MVQDCTTISGNACAQACRRAGGRMLQRTGTANPQTRCKGALACARPQRVLHRVSGIVAPACSPTWCTCVEFTVHGNMRLQIPGSAAGHVPNACCEYRTQCAAARGPHVRSVGSPTSGTARNFGCGGGHDLSVMPKNGVVTPESETGVAAPAEGPGRARRYSSRG